MIPFNRISVLFYIFSLVLLSSCGPEEEPVTLELPPTPILTSDSLWGVANKPYLKVLGAPNTGSELNGLLRQGDIVEISVTANNVGKTSCQANVSIYLGDPDNGGKLLSYSEIFILPGGTNTTSYVWQTESAGMQEIWVVLESDGTERVIGNNAAARSIFVSQPESQEYGLVYFLLILNIILAVAMVAMATRLRKYSKNSLNNEEKESESIDE